MNQNLSYKPGDMPTHEVAFAIQHNLLVDFPEARESLLNEFEFSDVITRRSMYGVVELASSMAYENAERKEKANAV